MKDSLTKLFGSHLVNLKLLPSDAVIIDAGASIGEFAKDILTRIPESMVYAIEPCNRNIEKLKEANLTFLFAGALVGEKEPPEMLFYEKHNLHEWGNVTNFYPSRKGETYNVRTISLNNLLQTYVNHNKIHYLKMDVEGSEWDIVNDMTEDIANRIEQISIEIHTHQEDITKKLESLGYKTLFSEGELYAVRQKL